MANVSGLVADLAILLLAPGLLILAYFGYRRGLYSYFALPIVFAVAFAIAVVILIVYLPKLRAME